MQIHQVVSVSRIKRIVREARCISCDKMIVEKVGRTVQIIIKGDSDEIFTRHLPIHKDCKKPEVGTIVKREEFVGDAMRVVLGEELKKERRRKRKQ